MSEAILTRCVEAETLDHLREDDPRAIRSRRDLRRINRIMGSVSIVDSLLNDRWRVHRHTLPSWGPAMARCFCGSPGAGRDMARCRAYPRRPARSLERANARGLCGSRLDGARCRHGRLRLARTRGSSALRRHRRESLRAPFRADALSRLFRAIARITDCFIACEPRRARVALLGSHLVGAIGANAVTRRDAVLSVRAGFRDRELSACWPDDGGWQLSETGARLFSHTFAAVRRAQA